MGHFDSRYWNLSQAAAWVVYRNRTFVNQLEHPTKDQWAAYVLYPDMHGYPKDGSIGELQRRLVVEDIAATGRRSGKAGALETIPGSEWDELILDPPIAYRRGRLGERIEPWIDVKFESKDLKKKWRGRLEVDGRTTFRWEVLEKMWREVCEHLPDVSENERISEVQILYEAAGYKEAPARSTMQNRIKRWK